MPVAIAWQPPSAGWHAQMYPSSMPGVASVLIQHGQVWALWKAASKAPRSWLIGQSVEADGSVKLITPVPGWAVVLSALLQCPETQLQRWQPRAQLLGAIPDGAADAKALLASNAQAADAILERNEKYADLDLVRLSPARVGQQVASMLIAVASRITAHQGAAQAAAGASVASFALPGCKPGEPAGNSKEGGCGSPSIVEITQAALVAKKYVPQRALRWAWDVLGIPVDASQAGAKPGGPPLPSSTPAQVSPADMHKAKAAQWAKSGNGDAQGHGMLDVSALNAPTTAAASSLPVARPSPGPAKRKQTKAAAAAGSSSIMSFFAKKK